MKDERKDIKKQDDTIAEANTDNTDIKMQDDVNIECDNENIDIDTMDDLSTESDKDKTGIKDIIENISNSSKSQKLTISVLALLLVVVLGITFISYNKKNQPAANENADSTQSAVHNISLDIRINEYVVSNNNTFRDDNWNSPDWIELYNYGDEPAWLGSLYLSDEEDDPTKFQLPDVTLNPNEYIVVLASGNTGIEDEYIRAPFQLGKDDKNILLSTDRVVFDKVDIKQLPTDVSAGYSQDGVFGYFAEPTPGYENTTQLFEDKDIEPINSYENLLIINEYLSSNRYGLTDSDGDHSDWIEIYNPNATPVFAGDIYLSDDENGTNKFRLPDIELQPNGYLLVYASGKTTSTADSIHAPFRISINDTKIVLSYKNGAIINSCDAQSLPDDVSAGIGENGAFGYFSVPTPNSVNNTQLSESIEVFADYSSNEESKIVINEWMSNNEFGILDKDGDASDWVEIHNTTDDIVSLDGYALSDSKDDLLKWVFPEGSSIPAKGYLVVYASSKDKVVENEMHASFSLDMEETLYLLSPDGKIAESYDMEYLPGNVSKGRVVDGLGYFALPTPKAENTTAYITELKQYTSFLHTELYISEVASSKIHLSRYKGRSMYEYIELYNSGGETIDLTGYKLLEDQEPSYTFNGVFIRPNEYLLVALKGWVSDTYDAVQADNLSLDSSGERILLKNKEGTTIDCFDTGYLLGSYSSGRMKGNADTRVFFTQKTPGGENSSRIYTSYASNPVFSQEGGMKDEAFYLEIAADNDATIYYTLNGSIPDADSAVYTQPIPIAKDTVVRAVAVSAYKLPSICMTRTFLLERKHDIPVVCISSAPAGLFYDNTGIYANGPGYGIGEFPYFGANYFRNLERLASVEYYEADGQLALAFDGGVQIAGGYSRARPQKSLAIRLRDEYGLGEVTYPFFDEGTSSFSHLFLRNGGQDGPITMMRDKFIHSCAMTLGTVDGKRGEPVVVYINGQYWGLYNLRDKLNSDHFKTKYNFDDDVEINILTEYSAAKSGTDEDWLDLKQFCISNDFSIEENYNKLAERVDVQSFMDYVIIETFFGNADTHNINFWKPEVEGAKWRPVLFDLDLAIFDLGYSMVDDYLNNYLGYHDHILDALKESDIFMDALLERYSYIACEVFTEEYLLGEIDAQKAEIANEMVYHLQRWTSPSSYQRWENNVEKLKTFMVKRRNDLVMELQEYFELDDATTKELFPYYYN